MATATTTSTAPGATLSAYGIEVPVKLPVWTPPAVTREIVDWANILTVDLSKYDSDRQELVDTVRTALERDGFFYVVGHGILPKTVRRANHFFMSGR